MQAWDEIKEGDELPELRKKPDLPQLVKYAAGSGVPLPGLLVPLSGLLATAGGLSVLLGYRARLGAWALVLFLIPVTLIMHAFWKATDPGCFRISFPNLA